MSGFDIPHQGFRDEDIGFMPGVESPYLDQIWMGVGSEVLKEIGYDFSVNDISRTLLRSEVKLSLGLDFLPQTQAEKTMAINGLEESLGRVKNKPIEASRKIFISSIESRQSAKLSLGKLEKIQNDVSVDNIKSSTQIMYEIAQFLVLENIFMNMSVDNPRFPKLSDIRLMTADYATHKLPIQNRRDLVENYWQALLDSRNRFNFWSDELSSVKNHPLAYKFAV